MYDTLYIVPCISLSCLNRKPQAGRWREELTVTWAELKCDLRVRPEDTHRRTAGMVWFGQSPSTKSLGTPYTPHCTDLGCSSNRHPLAVIAGESRMNGSLWG